MATAKTALEEAVEEAGGQSALARRLKERLSPAAPLSFRQGLVWRWLQQGYCPADHGICIAIEQITGVSKERLRPDVYQHPDTKSSDEERAAS